jgi:thiamine kinase-like enzyme
MAADDPSEVLALLGMLTVLAGRQYAVSELSGGLTNRNYRVTTTDGGPLGDYVVRVSANESGLLAIDRASERHNTLVAWQAGVGAPVVEALPAHNVLVVGFLSGRTLTTDDVRDAATIPRIAAAVRRLHAGPDFVGRFDFRATRRRYLEVVTREGFRLPGGYLDLAAKVEALEDAMRPGDEPLVPCNNDLLPGNFLDPGRTADTADTIWIIDYEYGGMNEASFELGNLASESFLSVEATEALVTAYWGQADGSKLARARAWSLLARYGWTLWASIQDGVSPIDFDFWSWGLEKYDSARAELLGPEYAQILTGLES